MKSEKNFSVFLPRRHKDTKFHEELPHSCFSDSIMSAKVDKVKIKSENQLCLHLRETLCLRGRKRGRMKAEIFSDFRLLCFSICGIGKLYARDVPVKEKMQTDMILTAGFSQFPFEKQINKFFHIVKQKFCYSSLKNGEKNCLISQIKFLYQIYADLSGMIPENHTEGK